uniref:Uncharacterized protein n=1 Tax=Ascaris lumbricoides TaxID=6252 RepID=A0A0M3II25_ASCLU
MNDPLPYSLALVGCLLRKSLIFSLFNTNNKKTVSDASSKSSQTKKNAQLANGTETSPGPSRRQHRTSVSSTHAPHFEPMPTIAEEDNETNGLIKNNVP